MKNPKIVLAEDDRILSKVIYEELTEGGFEVKQVFDGKESLTVISAERPSLVLLDILMPSMNGFEVLQQLKKSPATKDIPVIMLTMLGSDDDIKKGFQLGANDYIVKSQHAVSEIVEKVKEFFGDETQPEAKQAQQTDTAPAASVTPETPTIKKKSVEKKAKE